VFNPEQIPPVTSDEDLARFVLSSSHIRSSNGTVKPEAFMPHPRIELSLTRHRQATDSELWKEGERVAGIRCANLHGRADVEARAFLIQGLEVVAEPLPENPNHADVTKWPADRGSQKIKAILIAQASRLVIRDAS